MVAIEGDRSREDGAVECYGDRLCEPCAHLEALTGVGAAALAHRGGLRADILSDGEIAAGDLVVALPTAARGGRWPRFHRKV